MRDLGEHRLKDLTRHEHVFQVLAPGLPTEFGPIKTLENRPNNLPLQPTAFIGRERELEAVVELMQRPETRLLTLTGAGGTGKTRIALQAAAELLDDYQDGSFFVSLASITDPALVPASIGQELGLIEVRGQPMLETVRTYLRDRKLLLVLDNFEQVMDAAHYLPQLLAAAPGLNVIVTSRAALRVRGEQEFAVPPLSVPNVRRLPALAQLSQFDAVRLFIERARNVKPDFEVTNENAPAVAEICSRLDGLPLAIELAAARVRLLPPQSMLSRLQSRLTLLTGGARDLPARQRTLRGAMDWSYELLAPEVQRLFAYLSVFAGGCTLDAAEAVWNPAGELDLLRGLESLVENSLLRQQEQAHGEPRFLMLETIHEYAWEQLEQRGEAEDLRMRHARYFLSLAEHGAPYYLGQQPPEWLERMDLEHGNCRSALAWAKERQDLGLILRLSAALWGFWWYRGHITEGRAWCSIGLQAPDAEPHIRARALYGAGMLAREQRDYSEAMGYAEGHLALARELGDKRWLVEALNSVAVMRLLQGDFDRAEPLMHDALALYRELGDVEGIAKLLSNLGNSAMVRGEYDRAHQLLQEGLVLVSNRRVTLVQFYILFNLGLTATARSEYDAGYEWLARSLTVARDETSLPSVAIALEAIAGALAAQGNFSLAARLYGAAQRQLEATGSQPDATDTAIYEPYLGRARTQLGDARFAALRAEGHALSADEAIELALERAATKQT